MKIVLEVTEEFQDFRLDVFLNKATGDELSRTSIQRLIRDGQVSLNSTEFPISKPNYKVSVGEIFTIFIPPKKQFRLEPIQMDFEIVKEWEDFAIINKPAGLSSHGGPGDASPSLVNGLLYYFKELSKEGGIIRPGIVHRLDKPTSGLMIIAKNDKAHIALSKLFQTRKIEKTYFAWLIQSPKLPEGRIDSPIGRHPTERIKMCVRRDGRKSITNYKIIKTISSSKHRLFSLAEIRLETGRTHQIRVHFQSLGSPVVGDMLYSRTGNEFSKYGLLLFSQKLKFQNPFSDEVIELELEFPENFMRFEKEAVLK
ncbi:MAG: RluA family pseudouridine synthase [Leptospiraceae bacterium]|nr:RluA family pseudouridine synthase [Leptospiraceae bacterium]MCK6381667.1 RluA family pseudouridine synthase [Leptospiraceae bacterium]NUM40439.1 RluA family pseudouridine synthase [Leptospiraceae bacterium]